MNVVCFIAGLFVGANVGLFTFALMATSSRESRKEESEQFEWVK